MVYCCFLQNFCVFIKVFHFIVFLNEMYTCTICSEEGLMKIAEKVQRRKKKMFSIIKIIAIAAI